VKKIFFFLLVLQTIFSCNKKSHQNNEDLSYSNIDTFLVFSDVMSKSIENIVIKPSNYENIDNLPVIYLLHGAGGNHTDWISHVPSLTTFSSDNEIIIVCPNGGFNSWYFDSPIDSNYMYETYIVDELISSIDLMYSTSTSKFSRAITGNSMGGHGAFYLAIRNQDSFGAAGSMSGGLDIRPFSENWNISDRIGSIDLYPNNWEEHTVINMVNLVDSTNLKLIFDCGNNDFFLDVNNNFRQELVNLNIPHQYNIFEGSHDWIYWNEVVFYQLSFFKEYFSLN